MVIMGWLFTCAACVAFIWDAYTLSLLFSAYAMAFYWMGWDVEDAEESA